MLQGKVDAAVEQSDRISIAADSFLWRLLCHSANQNLMVIFMKLEICFYPRSLAKIMFMKKITGGCNEGYEE